MKLYKSKPYFCIPCHCPEKPETYIRHVNSYEPSDPRANFKFNTGDPASFIQFFTKICCNDSILTLKTIQTEKIDDGEIEVRIFFEPLDNDDCFKCPIQISNTKLLTGAETELGVTGNPNEFVAVFPENYHLQAGFFYEIIPEGQPPFVVEVTESETTELGTSFIVVLQSGVLPIANTQAFFRLLECFLPPP